MADHCNHIYDYYQRKVTERRRKRLKCNRLENLMYDYAMHSAFEFPFAQGAAGYI